MLNNFEEAYRWYSENAHRISGFEYELDDGSKRVLTNIEMYWLTQIKQAEDEGVDVPTDPQVQLEQALQDNATLRGLLREADQIMTEMPYYNGSTASWQVKAQAALGGKP